MTTIDRNGALHSGDGKYTNKPQPAAGYDLGAASSEPKPVPDGWRGEVHAAVAAQKTPGATIEYAYPGAPHLIEGRLSTAVGDSRFGNSGFRVEGCPCGEAHNISRVGKVRVIEEPDA